MKKKLPLILFHTQPAEETVVNRKEGTQEHRIRGRMFMGAHLVNGRKAIRSVFYSARKEIGLHDTVSFAGKEYTVTYIGARHPTAGMDIEIRRVYQIDEMTVSGYHNDDYCKAEILKALTKAKDLKIKKDKEKEEREKAMAEEKARMEKESLDIKFSNPIESLDL